MGIWWNFKMQRYYFLTSNYYFTTCSLTYLLGQREYILVNFWFIFDFSVIFIFVFLFLSLFTYISNFFTHINLSLLPSLHLYLYPTYSPYPLLLPCLHLHFFHIHIKIYTSIYLILTPYFSPCNLPLPLPLLYIHIFTPSTFYLHFLTLRFPLIHHIFPIVFLPLFHLVFLFLLLFLLLIIFRIFYVPIILSYIFLNTTFIKTTEAK